MNKTLNQIEAESGHFTLDSLSMEIIVACPNCNYELHLPSRDYLGRKGKCPKCEHRFIMEERATPKPAVSKPVPSKPLPSKPVPSKPIAKTDVPKPVPQPEKTKPAPQPDKVKPSPQPDKVKPAPQMEKPKPAKPPVKSRSDAVPVPAPVDDDFKNLKDPDFGSDEEDDDDASDSVSVSDDLWDEIDNTAGQSVSIAPGSTYRSGFLDVQARCPHCHNAIDFNKDVDLQDYPCPRCQSRISLIHPESQPQDMAMPQQVGAYVLHKFPRIGIGPFGTVYRAKEGQTQDPIAIKVSRGGIISEQDREKFLIKLRQVMQLKAPNIATVHEVGSVDDRVYLVSSFVSGVDLSEYLLGLAERKLSIREVAVLCGHIASLLHHAHRFGVFHGNLKPSNIRLAANLTPSLFDFCLNDHSQGLRMTGNGRIVGTAAYLAPEQLPGSRRDVDAQTDVYALGVILYELLTGQRPFLGEGQELLKQISKGSPMPPRAIKPEIPKPLETICLKCLEVNPKNRYQSALDVTKELRLFLEDKPIQTPDPGLWTQFSRWCKQRWILAGMLFTFLVLAAMGACYMGWKLYQTGGFS